MEQPRQAGASVIVLEGGGLIVELIQQDDAVSLESLTPRLRSNIHLHGIVKAGAILDDFEGVLASFRKKGVEIAFGPYPARPGQRANVIIRDNAGNLIQFFAKK